MENSTYNNIAVLIDADNTMERKMQSAIEKISTYGRIAVKRIYGNWQKECLKNWEKTIKDLAFKAQQQFDYVQGKNATDMALVVDAMDLLYTGRYDAFVIVAGDSDYTPLSMRLKETGIFVIGVGRKQNSSKAFIQSCDEFIYIDDLSDKQENNTVASAVTEEPKSTEDAELESSVYDEEAELHGFLKEGAEIEAYQDSDGFVNVASVGAYIKRLRPDFDIKKFGVKKLPLFVKKYPEKYEMTSYKGKGKVTIIAYKCR